MRTGPGGFKRLVVLRPVGDATLIPVSSIDPQLPVPHAIEELDGTAYAAYDFFPGATLKEITAIYRGQDQLPPLGLVLRICIDAARILSVAHTHQDPLGGPATFVHGGLSDSVLLMGFDGLVRVLDFGVRSANRYSAPEAVRGGPFDARSDVFSLAAVLHSALTAFQGSYVQVLQRTPSASEFPPPSAVHPDARPDLDVLVMHALMPERERRTGSLLEVANELERLAGASLPQPQACATRIRQLFEERLDGLRNMVPRLESDLTAQRFRPSRPSIPAQSPSSLPVPRRVTAERPAVAPAFESEQDEATVVKVEPPVHVEDSAVDGPDEATVVKVDAPVEAPIVDEMDRFDKTDVINPTPSLIMKSKPTAMQERLDPSLMKRTIPHVDVPWAQPGASVGAPPPPAAEMLDEPPTSSIPGAGAIKGNSEAERAAALGQELVSTGELPAIRPEVVESDEPSTGKLPPARVADNVIEDVADLKTVVKVTGNHPKLLPPTSSEDTGRILSVPREQPTDESTLPRRRSPVPIAIIAFLLVVIGGGFGYLAVTKPTMVRERFAAALIKWGLKKPPPPPPPEVEQQAPPPTPQPAVAAVVIDAGDVVPVAAVVVQDAGAAVEEEDLDGGEEEEDDAGVAAGSAEAGRDAGAPHKKTKHKKHPKAWWQTH